ncbi:MAG: trehalose-phosphatase [Tannerellaceae bacterium]|nr:trehalose-phosphatase [Tannerellaceae bacterium]MCD8262811.1 trehalose-phosphatase [Tannerellaceae bacterium]
MQQKLVENTNFHLIKEAYDKARKRLILLDYDGTLVAFDRNPQRTVPTPEVIELLTRLSGDKKNYVAISSGRDLTTLDRWLGNLPIGLAAEHGAFYKEDGKWHRNAEDTPWNDEIVRIIRQIIRKTPRSRLEIKKTALVWHYREVDAWLAELRVNQLINALIGPTSQLNLQIMKGNKIIEIKSSAYSKGTEAQRLMAKDNFDFIPAIGDDTTDEDMFKILPEYAVTIKVGKTSDVAKYNIPTQQQTLHFLHSLIE